MSNFFSSEKWQVQGSFTNIISKSLKHLQQTFLPIQFQTCFPQRLNSKTYWSLSSKYERNIIVFHNTKVPNGEHYIAAEWRLIWTSSSLSVCPSTDPLHFLADFTMHYLLYTSSASHENASNFHSSLLLEGKGRVALTFFPSKASTVRR